MPCFIRWSGEAEMRLHIFSRDDEELIERVLRVPCSCCRKPEGAAEEDMGSWRH